jgi:hypothetical protein
MSSKGTGGDLKVGVEGEGRRLRGTQARPTVKARKRNQEEVRKTVPAVLAAAFLLLVVAMVFCVEKEESE